MTASEKQPWIVPSARRILAPARPVLADAIGAVLDLVCADHVASMRREMTRAADLDDTALLDDLPAVLAAIATLFRMEGGLGPVTELGPPHATARMAQGFRADEVVGEYVLLRHNLRVRVAEKLGRQPVPAESEALEAAMHVLISLTVASLATQRETAIGLRTSARGDLLAAVAHDLRNELQAVLNSVALVEETVPPRSDTAPSGGTVDDLRLDLASCRRTVEWRPSGCMQWSPRSVGTSRSAPCCRPSRARRGGPCRDWSRRNGGRCANGCTSIARRNSRCARIPTS
jgi:signal transduction histidine kinase